ncbi:MAG: GNAT family N-acetyltransferase [Sphingobium sp.]
MDMASHPSPAAPQVAHLCAERWADLAAHAQEANAFYAPDMLIPALTHLAQDKTIRLLEASAGGTLIGLLPVVVHDRHGRLPIACTGNWMHDHGFFGAPLLRRGHAREAWANFLAQLDAAAWAPAFLYLQGIDAAGASAAALESLCVEQRRGFREVQRYDRAMLRSDLSADAYWEANVRSKKRKEIRRLQKRLADEGTVEQRFLTDPRELAGWCDAFLALEQAGWKGAQGSALASRPADAAFVREACANAFAGGRLHMLRIDLDGTPIAMLVNFRHLDGAFSFKIAFDEAMGRFSPGVLIELANLHAVQGDPAIAWMDSCAAPDHPMIDSLWSERRSIVQYRIALHGRGPRRLARRAAFALANGVEQLADRMKGQA